MNRQTLSRLFAALLCAAMILSLFACGNDETETTEAPGTESTETTAETTDSATVETVEGNTAETVDVIIPETTDTTVETTTITTEDTTEHGTTATTSEEVTTTETETEEQIDLDAYAIFGGDFTLKGELSSHLSSELDKAGIAKGKFGAKKSITVGNHSSALLQSAKTDVQSREFNYSDYTILCDGENLAIYGGSLYATQEAIKYIMDNYQKDGKLVVPKDLNYSSKPEVVGDITIGGVSIYNTSVVCDALGMESAAEAFAEELSRICGKKISVNDTTAEAQIKLVPETTAGETNFSLDYTASINGTTLIITAPTRASLSNAALNFVSVIKDKKAFADGYSENLSYEMKTYDATDVELFKYVGTWQATDPANPTTMVSYWDSAYVEIDFTGNALTLMFSTPTLFMYKIDGETSYVTVTDATEYTIFATKTQSVHTVRILYNDKSRHMYFAGVKAEKSVTLSRTPNKEFNIQFVGDSISDSGDSFSHNSADILGWDYSVIACQALSLVRNMGYWRYNNGYNTTTGIYNVGTMAYMLNKNFGTISIGMEDAFFKLGIPDAGKPAQGSDEFNDIAANYFTEKYDFDGKAGSAPDIVFIFLGTNDLSSGSTQAQANKFVQTYKSFVTNILEFYGDDTQICIMQALSTSDNNNLIDKNNIRYKAIDSAAAELINMYPDNVTYIDSDTVISWNAEISGDATHPTAKGYATLTSCVAEFLADRYS